jgi:uncharacterized protein (TIGR02145 family)
VVNDLRKIAPEGWHIPTSSEWESLYNYLGGIGAAGPKLISNGSSGFKAFPIGVRTGAGVFFLGESNATWWCNTELNSTNAMICGINFNSGTGGAFTNNASKKSGYSIRCIKD